MGGGKKARKIGAVIETTGPRSWTDPKEKEVGWPAKAISAPPTGLREAKKRKKRPERGDLGPGREKRKARPPKGVTRMS